MAYVSPRMAEPASEFYGIDTLGMPLEVWPQVVVELHCFARGLTKEEGGLGRFGHFRNAVDLIWNKPDSKDPFIWTPEALRMAEESCRCLDDGVQFLGVAGAASCGKSAFFAVWAVVNYYSSPALTQVVVLSTTLRAARQRIWKCIVSRWLSAGIDKVAGKLVDSMGKIKGIDSDQRYCDGTGIQLFAAEKKSEKDAVGSLIGIKSPRLFLIMDEAPELADGILTACDANLAANPNFFCVALGNPSKRYDMFGSVCKPADPRSWEALDVDTSFEWKTTRGRAIRFDAERNRNVETGRTVYPWMLTRQRIDEIGKKFGKDSLMYYRMVRGFWAPEGVEDGIYSEAELIRAGAQQQALWLDHPIRLMAVDLSFTSGGDRSVAYPGSLGIDTSTGLVTLEFGAPVTLKENLRDEETPRDHQIARQIKELALDLDIEPGLVCYDRTGAGSPFGSILSMEWSPKVVGITMGGKPSDRPVSTVDKAPAMERFWFNADELWFALKPFLLYRQIRGISDVAAKELTSRKFEVRTGRIKVQNKREYKLLMGESPDHADAIMLMVELARRKLGFSPGQKQMPSGFARSPAGMIPSGHGFLGRRSSTQWTKFVKERGRKTNSTWFRRYG